LKVLVLGASGMLGNAVMRIMCEKSDLEVYGTIRSDSVPQALPTEIKKNIIVSCDVTNQESLTQLFRKIRPDVVINCVGLVKQLAMADDPLITLPINAMLPHQLAHICSDYNARLVHISTDCVFSGTRGNYKETDISDAQDLYGKSKFIGEVNYPHTVTLRTSIIGHELQSAHSLISWFLSQKNSCKGFRKVIFSGLPTVVLAKIIRDIVLPKTELTGLFHVAAQPISKYDLLSLVAKVYEKPIEIIADDQQVLDRSLNAEKFKMATGYEAPPWDDLIKTMHTYQ
jgi:dTDP-4-dehydrorhamnose reductase